MHYKSGNLKAVKPSNFLQYHRVFVVIKLIAAEIIHALHETEQINEWTNSLDIASRLAFSHCIVAAFHTFFCHLQALNTKARSMWNFLFCHDNHHDTNERMRTFETNFATLQHVITLWNIVVNFN